MKPSESKVSNNGKEHKPIVCIVLGMAGSGKTTMMQRINSHAHKEKLPIYTINLDPAVSKVPYGCNIDIRKTVNYQQVMKKYNLGPNGSILTCLNLFSTKFNQVVELIQKKEKDLKYVFIDTPGQIEIFTWSASGQIVTNCLSSCYPTCLLYVVDTPRTKSPITFMSNMLYACSIMYKFRLPFTVVFNKIDIEKHDFAVKWMTDFDEYNKALKKDESYSSSLAFSMSLVLEEFYNNLSNLGFSAITGEGIDDLFVKINLNEEEYYKEYYQELIERQKKLEKLKGNMKVLKEKEKKKLEERKKKREERKKLDKKKQIEQLLDDLEQEEKRIPFEKY